ncbi:NUDIX hydrolase [Methanosphaera sp.]|uniref:NUDIX hydrolase n=1 Tax=Methanosphaera sp. TaxID=2666342 RepID=UPI0025CD0878|nr:NUDIX hydrolase [Methanosphaera sp.]MEE1117175.1 NUDIX hydrolase [Methanosphaera sp.]MEE3324293.1 NUDIX hydrolase [Methanosphaera sp.]MEE3419107.1 NUDIX hydrolase [Methanosphaera sp.]
MTKYKNPALTVDTIIIEDNKVILIKRLNNPFKDHWAIPGGFVEYGEKVEDAAVREAKEETGLDIELTKLVGVYSDPDRDPRGHTVTVAFLSKIIGGTLKSDSDAKDAKFIDISELKNMKLAFDHNEILKDSGIL